MTSRGPTDEDFADFDAEADAYLEDDDRFARGLDVPHDDGEDVIVGPVNGTDDQTRHGDRSRSTSDHHFAAPAEAMVRDLQAMIDALGRGQIAEHDVIPCLTDMRVKRMPSRTRAIANASAPARAQMDERADGRQRPLATPWSDLNDQLPGGGFWPGAHILVGGTGVQKTGAAIAIALEHARNGGSVLYAGLELEDEQLWIRFAAEMAGVRWSACITGTATEEERRRIHAVAPELDRLAIRFEPDDERGWSVSRLRVAVAEVLAEHPHRPLLVVVDFLQIIAGEPGEREELRERIRTATYAARHVARRKGVTVLLVSSIARQAYSQVNGLEALVEAGLGADLQGETVVERYLRNRDVLVGLGKESGEIEYSADTVIVAMTMPREPKKIERRVVLAVAKVRAGREGWCSLLTNGHSFRSEPTHGRAIVTAIEDFLAKKKARGASKSANSNGTGARGARVDDKANDDEDEQDGSPYKS